jgi:hypothetical protein
MGIPEAYGRSAVGRGFFFVDVDAPDQSVGA